MTRPLSAQCAILYHMCTGTCTRIFSSVCELRFTPFICSFFITNKWVGYKYKRRTKKNFHVELLLPTKFKFFNLSSRFFQEHRLKSKSFPSRSTLFQTIFIYLFHSIYLLIVNHRLRKGNIIDLIFLFQHPNSVNFLLSYSICDCMPFV